MLIVSNNGLKACDVEVSHPVNGPATKFCDWDQKTDLTPLVDGRGGYNSSSPSPTMSSRQVQQALMYVMAQVTLTCRMTRNHLKDNSHSHSVKLGYGTPANHFRIHEPKTDLTPVVDGTKGKTMIYLFFMVIKFCWQEILFPKCNLKLLVAIANLGSGCAIETSGDKSEVNFVGCAKVQTKS
jgi:hypothetical protein